MVASSQYNHTTMACAISVCRALGHDRVIGWSVFGAGVTGLTVTSRVERSYSEMEAVVATGLKEMVTSGGLDFPDQLAPALQSLESTPQIQPTN